MDKTIGFLGFSIIILVGLVFVVEAVKEVYSTAEDIDDISLSGTESFVYTSPETIDNVGQGITSLSSTSPNQTWLNFDGVDDWVNLTDSLKGKRVNNLNNIGYTYLINLKYTNTSGGGRVMGLSNNLAVRILGNVTTIQVFCGNSTGLMTSAVSVTGVFNQWLTLGIEYNMSNCKVYKDGVYQTATNFISNNVTWDNKNLNAFTGSSFNLYYNGSTDEFMVYNRSFYNAFVHKELYYRSSNKLGIDDGVPVVLFHRVEEDIASTNINTTMFDSFMNASYNAGMHTITVDEYLNYRRGTFTLPSKPFIITFDDADNSVYTNATPILDKYGYRATFFIITNDIGTTGRVTWNQLDELLEKGWSIGSHTANHYNLTNLTYSNVTNELNYSKNAIIGNLSYIPVSFSCPYSIHNATIDIQIANFYNISFCDYWTIPSESLSYLHNNFNLVGTNNTRGDVSNASTVNNFLDSINIFDGLIAYFKFNENNGTIAYDSSGNSNNGTISGATWQTDGQTRTLVEGVDYSKTKTTFSLLNNDYLYSWIDTSYNYDSMTSDGNRNATVLRLAGIVIISGLLFFCYWFIKNQMGWID